VRRRPDPRPRADATRAGPSLDLGFGTYDPTWTISNVPLLPGTSVGTPQDISDDRVVVGYGVTASYASHAFYWTSAGGTQPLPTGSFGGASRATAISDNGRYIVGYVKDASGIDVAVRWERLAGGGMDFQDLRTCTGESAWGYGVSNGGVVVGQRGATAVKWTGVASCAAAIVVSGTAMRAAHAINDGGAIVGMSPLPYRGFTANAPSLPAFVNPLPGDAGSRATGVNELGEIVGLSWNGSAYRAIYQNPITLVPFALGPAHAGGPGLPRISDRGRTIWENAAWSGRTTRGTEIRSLLMAPTGVNTCGDIVGVTSGGQGQLYKKNVCDP
jgi:uncharacterized membrane protein